MNVFERLLSSLFPQAFAGGFNAADITSLSRVPPYVLGGAAVGLALAVVIGFLSTTGAPPRVRVALLALRTLLAIAVMIVLLEPGLRLMATSREANRVVVALDASGSMAEKDGAATTRMQEAVTAARALVDDLGARAQPFTPEVWLFDEEWRRASPEELDALASGKRAPEGKQSKLALPLEHVAVGEGEKPLGGVVIISDGADTAGLDRAFPVELREKARALGAPVHTALVGEPARFKDLALEKAVADEFAFVRNKLNVDVVVRHKGFPGQLVRLTLKEDGRPVATTEVTLPSDAAANGQVKASFTFEPQRAGKRVYTVQAPVLPEETVVENNRVDFTLQLIRDRIRVLQVAGRPSWDEKFVRRLLKENPSVDLISFFILRSTTDVSNANTRELSLIPFPTRELFTEELGTFDVVIFQDFNFRPYQMGAYLDNVRAFVEESGGGFMMIGGDLSFSEGEYDGTPLADILPVTLLPGTGHLSTEAFTPLATDAGKSHPITDLGDVTAGEGYASLPQLEGLNLVAGLAEGAEVLLAHPFLNVSAPGASGGSVGAPVVAVREVGKGRSMAILTDTTWVWSLPHVGNGGRGDAHRRFFANALRWLIRDPELSRAKIIVDLPDASKGIEPGVEVPLEVRTFNAKYQPEGKDPVKITLVPLDAPDSTPPVVIDGVTGDDGTFRTTLPPPAPGAWRVRVEARDVGGKAIGADEDAFVVRATATEKLHIEPRADVMQAIAAAGAGKAVSADDVRSLEFTDHEVERVHRQRTEPLWNQPWALAVIVVLAGVEWWWRRRRGFA